MTEPQSERRAIAVQVVSVRVLEDRAFVRREGRVTLEAGLVRLTIEGMAMFGGFGISSEVPEQAVEGLRTARARRRGEPAPVSV